MMPFQTPPAVCDYMVSLCLGWVGNPKWLEPTPGDGNLVAAIRKQYPDADITAPDDFFDLVPSLMNGKLEYPKFHVVVMNPPFTPMISGWKFLQHCMQMSNYIVALLPWFIVINSERRLKILKEFGLASITHLPRSTFPGSRIQCCVLQLTKPYKGDTIFKTFEF